MAVTGAGNTRLDATGAQVVVTIIADAAVVVLVGNGAATVVAVDEERPTGVLIGRNKDWMTLGVLPEREYPVAGLRRDGADGRRLCDLAVGFGRPGSLVGEVRSRARGSGGLCPNCGRW